MWGKLAHVVIQVCSLIIQMSCSSFSGSYFEKRGTPENETSIGALKDTQALSLIDCTRQCLEYPGCDKEAYHLSNGRCILAGDETMANIVVEINFQDSAWVFYENSINNNENQNEQGCGVDPGWSSFNGSCYFVAVQLMDWENSGLFCDAEEAHLATIRSLNEHAFVLNKLNDTLRSAFDVSTLANTFVWIGANDIVSEGEYKWVTNETWDFVNWEINEPTGGDENCVAMSPVANINGQTTPSSGLWQDSLCASQNVFVCEREIL